ncbi:MAG: hypothetical protein JKY81_00180 [Colwellia sp.]|nr:hypothetical protein [Colwellia sp.]
MSNLDQYTVEELDHENKELKASNAELRAKIEEFAEIAIDIENSETSLSGNGVFVKNSTINEFESARYKLPSRSLADIKADAIEELIKEKAYSAQVNGIATSIIDADGAIQYADKLRAKS